MDWEVRGLSFRQVSEGIIVYDGSHSYLARHWVLSLQFKAVVSAILNSGLHFTVQVDSVTGTATHPREANVNTDKGVEYVAFSHRRDHKWVLALDQYSGRPAINQVTVNKCYSDLLIDLNIAHHQERGGGKNFFVGLDDLPRLLTYMTVEVADHVNS